MVCGNNGLLQRVIGSLFIWSSLTESIWSKLEQIHPDGNFAITESGALRAIGQDSCIYWRITESPEKAQQLAEAEKQRAEEVQKRADLLAAKLRELNIDPDLI